MELSDYQALDKEIVITIKQQGSSKYRVQFIGKGGSVLKETITNPAIYQYRGDETYVRGKVLESNGRVAWTQPAWRIQK